MGSLILSAMFMKKSLNAFAISAASSISEKSQYKQNLTILFNTNTFLCNICYLSIIIGKLYNRIIKFWIANFSLCGLPALLDPGYACHVADTMFIRIQ